MKQFRNIPVLLVFALMHFNGFGQQLPQFTQYMYNTISINPAYAGSREVMVVNLLGRNQWIGVKGAPVTQTLSVHSSVPNTNLGVGLSFINDKLGYEKTTYAFADVSYTINLDSWDEYKVSFGIKGGFTKYSIDDELLNDPEYSSDPFLNTINNNWNPNVGVGVYFRGDSFYFGFSAPKLFTNKNNSEYFSLDRMTYFLNGGYVFNVNNNLIFKPTFLVKYTDGAPLSVDLSTLFFINENLWLGASYRFSDSFGAIVNFKIMDGVTVGYSYDYITSNLKTSTSGSHGILLNIELNFPKPRCLCKDLYN